MRFEIVQLPQAVDRVLVDTLRLGHQPATTMGHALWLALQGCFDDCCSPRLIVARLAPTSFGDLLNWPDALLADPAAPQLHRRSADRQLLADRHIVPTGKGGQDDAAAERHLLRCSVRRLPSLQLNTVSRFQLDRHAAVGTSEIIATTTESVNLFMGHYTRS